MHVNRKVSRKHLSLDLNEGSGSLCREIGDFYLMSVNVPLVCPLDLVNFHLDFPFSYQLPLTFNLGRTNAHL